MENIYMEKYLENIAHFLLCGQVNRKNHVFWRTQAPDEVFQKPLHSTKCTAW